MQNKARNILQLKIQIRACIPYRDGSQPTILHSDHATVGPHGCFEIMLRMMGMIMFKKAGDDHDHAEDHGDDRAQDHGDDHAQDDQTHAQDDRDDHDIAKPA